MDQSFSDRHLNKLCFILFFIVSFAIQMNFRGYGATTGTGNFDLQVLLRLAILFGGFLYCATQYKHFFKLIYEAPVLIHATLLLYLFVVTGFSENVTFYAIYALITITFMFYITTVIISKMGILNTMYCYICMNSVFCLLSILAYYFVPDLGRYIYWQDDALFVSSRMSGISGHPNTLGFICAVSLIMFMHLKIQKHDMHKIIYVGVALMVLCLILTNSRTSIIGLVMMLGLYSFLYLRLFTFSAVMGCVLFFVCLIAIETYGNFIPELTKGLSRSGNAEEITSLTGRSQVWEQLFLLIEEKPIAGWGHASIGTVLEARRDEIGFDAGQAHNLYLQLLFSGGAIGFLLYLINIAFTAGFSIFAAYRLRNPLYICLILYFMLSGFTETFILSSIANGEYTAFVICLSSLSLICFEQRSRRT
jgi:exopolysaccharide production protein ExoQ